MKVALVYDWLNVKVGGGEATFFEIAKLYPQADIYCLVYNKKLFSPYLKNRTIITSRLNKFPNVIKKRPYLLLPHIKKAVDKLDFTGYDLVISVSSAWVKNITVPKETCHISYCYSPARMIWDSWPKYLDTQKIGPFKLGAISRYIITRRVSKLRLWDFYQSKEVDSFIAISHYIARRIQKYYHRSSKLVYPPVKIFSLPENNTPREYYLCVSTLSQYKNIELVIRTFAKSKEKLIIAGDGPDRQRLEAIAAKNSNIKFVGRVSEEQKVELLQGAKAFIFPSIEDFGIAPVEALSTGTPVIALRAGGLLETIQEGKTGIFFDTATTQSLQAALNTFAKTTFNPKTLHAAATKFSTKSFCTQFPETITKLYNQYQHDKE